MCHVTYCHVKTNDRDMHKVVVLGEAIKLFHRHDRTRFGRDWLRSITEIGLE